MHSGGTPIIQDIRTRADLWEQKDERGTLDLSNQSGTLCPFTRCQERIEKLAGGHSGLKWPFSEARPDLQSLQMDGLKTQTAGLKVATTRTRGCHAALQWVASS